VPKYPSRTPIGSTALDAYRKVFSRIAGSSQPLGTKTTVYLRVEIDWFGSCLTSVCNLLLRCGIKSFPRPGKEGGGSATPNVDNSPQRRVGKLSSGLVGEGNKVRLDEMACNAERGLEAARGQEREKAAGSTPESTETV